MRLDIVLPNEGSYALESLNSGAHFEAMGWEGLWVTDHLLGLEEDVMHQDEWVELVVAMTHLAATTKSIRICSGILVAAYRNPVLAARMITSIDQLSGGRVDLGVGVGWSWREYQALGVGHAFKDRGAYTNEILDVMLACWKGGLIEFKGQWFNVPPVVFEPSPVQPGKRVPLWIGTHSSGGGPFRRVAKYADYWHPSEGGRNGSVMTPQAYREYGDRIDEIAGRKIPRTLRLRCAADPQETVDLLHLFAEAGCVQAACSFITAGPTFGDFSRAAEAFYDKAASLREA